MTPCISIALLVFAYPLSPLSSPLTLLPNHLPSRSKACYQFDDDDLSVHIVVPSNTTYIEGEDVILSCLIANTTQEAVVTWTTPTQFECDSINSTCDSSDYVILSSYDETLCQWTCNLMIKHFNSSLAGEYSCKTGTHMQNITLQVAGE